MLIDTGIDQDLNENSPRSSDAENKLKECQEKLLQAEERYKYLSADFENFRRNTAKDRAHWMQTAQEQVLKEILPIVDDFDRASSELGQSEGFDIIRRSLLKLLEKYEITEIPATGQFDPSKHEALMRLEAPGVESGVVVQVFQKGYMRKGIVIRPAQVSVAQ